MTIHNVSEFQSFIVIRLMIILNKYPYASTYVTSNGFHGLDELCILYIHCRH